MAVEAQHALIGNPKGNFWLHHSEHGFDLTHPASPAAPKTFPRVPLQTSTERVAIDPGKSALVIIDMQNLFLSPRLGYPTTSNGIKACDQLLKHALPACREAGIQVIWLNWGLTEEEVDNLPPATKRAFGFQRFSANEPLEEAHEQSVAASRRSLGDVSLQEVNAEGRRVAKGPGLSIGPVEVEEGVIIDGGRLLMRDQWNTALYAPMERARQQGMSGKSKKKDVWIHKNRMSGLWGSDTLCTRFLDDAGISTLIFAGVNTDQCVGGSLQDAFAKSYDCLLLSDGSATTSPEHSQQCVEFNTAKVWGFLLSCEQLAEGVKNMEHS